MSVAMWTTQATIIVSHLSTVNRPEKHYSTLLISLVETHLSLVSKHPRIKIRLWQHSRRLLRLQRARQKLLLNQILLRQAIVYKMRASCSLFSASRADVPNATYNMLMLRDASGLN